MFMPQDNKQTQAVMFDPMKEREAMRKRKMAEMLMQQGNQPDRNEMAGGMTVKRSPWEDINKAAQKFYGQYQLEQADAKDAEIEKARQQRVAEALSQWGTNPQGAAEILGQDPKTQEMAMRLMQGELDYGRQKERWAQQDALQREMIQARAAGGGNTPAAIQIANRMFELEQAMNNPNVPDAERFLAQREYNLLGQAAKTYAFDRGTEMMPDMSGYQGVYKQPPQMPQPPQMQQPPQQGAIDPIQQHAMAVQQQQAQTGVSPMQRPELANQQIYNTPQIREIEGYGQLMADRAAQKKMAESIAAEEGKRLGEAQGTLTFLEANIPKLENVVSKLDTLADQATYTTAGRGVDLVRKELGMEPRQSAVARAEYIATVDNEVLPLLRDTFGAAFTVKEGETLRNTLGDPNKSPAEKKAVLNAFISQKKAQVQALQRQVGVPQRQQPQGQIAVNPQTGERMINRGNGWEPLQ